MEKSIDSSGCNVHYDVYNPNKEPCIVLIHGYGVTGKMWEPQLESLNDFKVIVPDLRGHGKSRPCVEFAVIAAANDIIEILKKEACEKAYLIGLSMGGYVAQEIGRLYPEKILGMIVSGATPVFMKYPKWETISLKYSGGMLKMFPWEYLKKYMSKYTSIDNKVRIKLYEMFSEMTKQEFITSWNGIATCLHEEDVDFKFPLSFICGENDKSGTIKMHSGDWEKLYPYCVTHVIKNASHMVNMDNPDEFNKIMLDFIN